MLVDSHIHLDHLSSAAFEALEGRAAAGTYRALVPGISPEQWVKASRLGERSWIDLAYGLHPWESQAPATNWEELLRERLSDSGVVAIGEVGLDHARWKSSIERERAADIFVRQIELARSTGLPLVLHCVRAHADAAALVRQHGKGVRGVVHAFSGSQEEYALWGRLGFVIGLGSMVTRPEAKRVREAARFALDGTFLLETDAPFMSTTRERSTGLEDGSGSGIEDVLSEIAQIRQVEDRFLSAQTGATFAEIFSRG